MLISDIAIFVLKRDVKLQLTNWKCSWIHLTGCAVGFCLQQLNDSSLIISLLESFLYDKSRSIPTLLSYYPVMESENARGKTVYEYPNKYFVMYGEGSGTDDQK